MKLYKNRIARMIERGMLHCNEAAAPAPVADAGGGEAAPSSDAGAPSGGDSGIDWSGMFSDSDDSVPVSEPQGSEPAAPPVAESAPVTTQPAAPAQPVAASPVQPVAQPAPAAQPQPAQTQAPELAQPQQTPEQQEAARVQAREAWRGTLAQQYQLSDEQRNALLTDPGSVLPDIAADLHVSVMEQTMQFLRQSLPDIIAQQQRQNAALAEGQNAFFEAWPELRGKEAVISQIGAIWRQANPYATREEFIAQVGPLAWNAAGMSLSDLVNRGGTQSAPAASPAPQGGYSPAPQAATGGVAAVPNTPVSLYAGLASEWEND